MKLKDLGEFELIERMAAVFRAEKALAAGAAAFSRLAIGIGDDAAVWRDTPGGYTIATTDAMVEGIHFTRGTTGWYDLGWKAMASNISDIGGMGGIPRFCLAVLGASGELRVDDALEICRGMADLAGRFGAAVVGGDTVSSPVTMLTITVLGDAVSGPEADGNLPILSRFAARPGQLLAVTGRLGSSAGGLELMLRGGSIPERYAPLLESHRRPMPRVRDGQLLVEAGVRCGMDLSDGLVGDLTRICRASGVAAVVEAEEIPMDPLLTEAFGDRALEMALCGGEDYELLCAGSPESLHEARLLLQSVGSTLTVVGRLRDVAPGRAAVMLADAEGREREPRRSGWEHFAGGGDAP